MCRFLQDQRRTIRCCLGVFVLMLSATSPAKEPKADRLIVPGERIGSIQLGARGPDGGAGTGKAFADDASLGSADSAWYVGPGSKDGGKPFCRPADIWWHGHRDEEGHHYITSRVAVTSSLYATAEGVKPGDPLAAIQAAFPDVKHDPDSDTNWPGLGDVEFFHDGKRGISFALLKSSGSCLEIEIYPPANDSNLGGLTARPAVSFDYDINSSEGSIGNDLKLGLSEKALRKLLGKPASNRFLGTAGTMRSWRLPSQKVDEPPALAVNFMKLPDGSLVANCLRVSSPLFHLQAHIFPGCHLEDVKGANAFTAWLDSYETKEGRIDLYGDFHSGEVFEVRASDGVCTAISLVPPLLQTATDLGKFGR